MYLSIVMSEEEISDWVESKLDEGQSKDVLKQSLERQGFDPSIVDEVSEGRETSSSEFSMPEVSVEIGELINMRMIISSIVLLFGIIFYIQLGDIGLRNNDGISGEFKTISLGEVSANPIRPTINESSGIRFVNDSPYSFNVSFDRDIDSFSFDPGEEVYRNISRIAYFNAEPLNGSGRTVKGGVNIR